MVGSDSRARFPFFVLRNWNIHEVLYFQLRSIAMYSGIEWRKQVQLFEENIFHCKPWSATWQSWASSQIRWCSIQQLNRSSSLHSQCYHQLWLAHWSKVIPTASKVSLFFHFWFFSFASLNLSVLLYHIQWNIYDETSIVQGTNNLLGRMNIEHEYRAGTDNNCVILKLQ